MTERAKSIYTEITHLAKMYFAFEDRLRALEVKITKYGINAPAFDITERDDCIQGREQYKREYKNLLADYNGQAEEHLKNRDWLSTINSLYHIVYVEERWPKVFMEIQADYPSVQIQQNIARLYAGSEFREQLRKDNETWEKVSRHLIKQLRKRAQSSISPPNWVEAIEAYQAILVYDESDPEAKKGLEYAQEMQQLEQRRDAELAKDDRSWKALIAIYEDIFTLSSDPKAAEGLVFARKMQRLEELFNDASQAKDNKSWKALIAIYEEILTLSPDPEAKKELEHARKMLRLEELFNDASQAKDNKSWKTLIAIYEDILTLSSDPKAAEGLVFARKMQRLQQLQHLKRWFLMILPWFLIVIAVAAIAVTALSFRPSQPPKPQPTPVPTHPATVALTPVAAIVATQAATVVPTPGPTTIATPAPPEAPTAICEPGFLAPTVIVDIKPRTVRINTTARLTIKVFDAQGTAVTIKDPYATAGKLEKLRTGDYKYTAPAFGSSDTITAKVDDGHCTVTKILEVPILK